MSWSDGVTDSMEFAPAISLLMTQTISFDP